MLLFYRATPHDPDPSVLADRGIRPRDGNAIRLWTGLQALPNGPGPILVVNRAALPAEGTVDARSIRVPDVPAGALENVDPFRSPRPVTAAGGVVACPVPDDVAVLLIFRRGVWDLPKGTRDGNEEIAECARREVREEVGVDAVDVTRALGSTRHGYPDGDHFAVKTTEWFLMRTTDRSFDPDREEGIERVARARWDVARRHVGYENLRRHMDRIEDDVRDRVES